MSAPVRHTCPDIDRCKKNLQQVRDYIDSAISNLEYLLRNAPNDFDAVFSSIKDDLNTTYSFADIDGELEELRDANSSLRDWGHELEKECRDLEDQLSDR